MARRQEQLRLAAALRASGTPAPAIARVLRTRFGVRALAAMRLAHGWSQSDAAAGWTRRWPDSPRTFKNFSYWENWPGPSGHAPSLEVIERLCLLYGCGPHDLLADLPDHGTGADDRGDVATLVWQVQNLELPELTEALSGWAADVPEADRRVWLLTLSTAAAAAAPARATTSAAATALTPVTDLRGTWTSRYRYPSTSRGVRESVHVVDIDHRDGRLLGRSRPDPSGSALSLDLGTEGTLVTGTWRERTSPEGHYRADTYHGVVQFVLDPTGATLSGRWLGISKRYTIKSGEWRLERAAQPSPGPDTSRTTVSPANSPSSTSAVSPSRALPT